MASDVGIDALNIKDAASGLTVPVAGDFVDDGSGTPKWFQALVVAFGSEDGARSFVQDVDGSRLPITAPGLVALASAIVSNAVNNRDVTPPLKALNGNEMALADGDVQSIVPTNDGHVMVRLQFFADTPDDPNTYIRVGFGDKTPGLRLYDTGDPDDIWTDESVTVTCVGGSGTVTWQPWTVPVS